MDEFDFEFFAMFSFLKNNFLQLNNRMCVKAGYTIQVFAPIYSLDKLMLVA